MFLNALQQADIQYITTIFREDICIYTQVKEFTYKI